MRRVVVYNTMRLNSQRIPRKLLEVIGRRSLAQIAIDNMLLCQQRWGVTSVAGICYTDQELIDLCHASGLEVHVRDIRSRDAETCADAFWQLPAAYAGRFDWVLTPNLCHPFLRAETLHRLCHFARHTPEPRVTVRKQRGLVWNADDELVIGAGAAANTKTNPEYSVLAHLAYICPLALVDDDMGLSAAATPLELDLTSEELIDIDTPEELLFARTYAKGLGL